MRYSLLVCISLFSCTSLKNPSGNSSNDLSPYRVIAYVRGMEDDWGQNFEKANKITHINYAFANIRKGKIVLGKDSDAETLEQIINLKRYNPKLKILISVGGWGWSGGFSDAVLTPESRELFANSAIELIKKHRLDGVDLDWEYPGLPGAGNKHRTEDKENFTAILKLLREKLDKQLPNQNLLTIATGASQSYLDHTDLATAQQYLDFINIMTYDFYTGGSNVVGHHSNFEASSLNPDGMSVTKAIIQHLKADVPKSKLVVGVPFYGRWWIGARPSDHGLYQDSNGARGSISYKALEDTLRSKSGFIRNWDKSAKAPYLWREKDSCFVTYEDSNSLKIKTDYVKNEGLGGIMFWQFGGDNGTLLNTIHESLSQN